MSDRVKANDGSLMPAGRSELATAASANPLVARGLAELNDACLAKQGGNRLQADGSELIKFVKLALELMAAENVLYSSNPTMPPTSAEDLLRWLRRSIAYSGLRIARLQAFLGERPSEEEAGQTDDEDEAGEELEEGDEEESNCWDDPLILIAWRRFAEQGGWIHTSRREP